jgi:hypothetical protein
MSHTSGKMNLDFKSDVKLVSEWWKRKQLKLYHKARRKTVRAVRGIRKLRGKD